ncbi:MAG: hypothetical protein ABI462_12360, partial [Ignavibacteria bacterium]
MSGNIDNSNEVFSEINKRMKYGAPELKKLYQKYVTRGLMVAVILETLLSVSSLAYILWAKEKEA